MQPPQHILGLLRSSYLDSGQLLPRDEPIPGAEPLGGTSNTFLAAHPALDIGRGQRVGSGGVLTAGGLLPEGSLDLLGLLDNVVLVSQGLLQTEYLSLVHALGDGLLLVEGLDPLDIVFMERNLLLEDIEVLVELDYQLVLAVLQLDHQMRIQLLGLQVELLELRLLELQPQPRETLGLVDFQVFQLLPEVSRLLNPLLQSYQPLLGLVIPQLPLGLELHRVAVLVEVLLQHYPLLEPGPVEVLQLLQPVLLELQVLLLVLDKELLQHLLAYLLVPLQLARVDIAPEHVLPVSDEPLQLPDLGHQLVEHLVVVDHQQVLRGPLHTSLDEREEQDLLVLVEEPVIVLVETIEEVLGGDHPQDVRDPAPVPLKDTLEGLEGHSVLGGDVRAPHIVPDALTDAGTFDE